ncbi:protein kinase family protein [Mycoplasmoides alvi]|uniref:hypothetical protein n=1 Tax=Mycoplasmoides alvi TaxID=78580 RepID=UPI00051C9492|nr:hypothetical protein [Mycoplasmoides alvi]
MNDFKVKAINIFKLYMPNKLSEIKSIKIISNGFTNFSYKVVNTKDQKYQVRVGNKKIDRNNEYAIVNKLKNKGDFIFYDKKNGNAIKKWIDGNIPSIKVCKSDLFLKSFANELFKLQKLDTSVLISKRNFFVFEDIANFNGLKNELKKYHQIIEKYRDLPIVVSHNDLRPSNLIWNNKNVKFIDYEWGSLNNNYWDLCNFLREIKYPIKNLKKLIQKYFEKLDYEIVLNFMFATTFFAYQWTFFPKQTKEIITYRENTKKLINKYYSLIK